MSVLTREDLREELEQFASNTFHRQLSQFSADIRDHMSHGLGRNIASKACPYSSAATGSDNLSPVHLPGQLPSQTIEAIPEGAQVTLDHTGQESGAISFDLNLGEDTATMKSYTAAKEKISVLRAAVVTEPYMSDELSALGYFRRSGAKSKLVEIACEHPTVDNAKEAMLRMDANPTELMAGGTNTHALDAPQSRGIIASLIRSHRFEYCMTILICLNATYIGIETEIITLNYSALDSPITRAIDLTFFIIFATELGLRIFVLRWWFFKCTTPKHTTNRNLTWNLLDCFIVSFQAVEIILRAAHVSDTLLSKVAVLRLLRILRIGRLFRMAKALEWVSSLRVIVTCVRYSMSSFVWAVVSLQAVTFLFSVYFAEVAMSRLMDEEDPLLQQYFGSLSVSWYSLLQAVSGGVDWSELTGPLRRVGILKAFLPFCVYLFFTLLVLMNIFTAIFLEQALVRANQETEIQLLRHAYRIFRTSDCKGNNTIAKEDFHESLAHPDVHKFFDAINLDIQQAEVLFELLDSSGDGLISCDEFLRGCLRVRGTAKALDLLILSREVTQLLDGIAAVTKQMITDQQRTSKDNHRLLAEILRATKITSDADVAPQEAVQAEFLAMPQPSATQQAARATLESKHSNHICLDSSEKDRSAFVSILPSSPSIDEIR